jgi:hypothetical protein
MLSGSRAGAAPSPSWLKSIGESICTLCLDSLARAIDYESLYTQLLQKCDDFDQRERFVRPTGHSDDGPFPLLAGNSKMRSRSSTRLAKIKRRRWRLSGLSSLEGGVSLSFRREECAVLRRELESLRQVTISSPRKNQKNEPEDESTDWTKKLEETSAEHLAVSGVDLALALSLMALRN